MTAVRGESLQTIEPLVELRTRQTARPLSWFEQLADGDESELDVDQPYQRGDVWDDDRRRLLIRSLMQGVPIGAITVNNRFTAKFHEPAYGPVRTAASNRNWAVAIIDGKQRFTAFVRWLRSELTVPASWFPASEVLCQEDTVDGPHVRLSGLVRYQGRRFGNIPVSVVEAVVQTLDEERGIFDLINFGGVAQGETD
jgi:hypothetical protein